MRTQSIDTSPEFERVQIAHLRTFSPVRKFASTCNWTHSITYMNLYAGRDATQQLSEQDITRFIAREYGSTLATAFQHFVEQHSYDTIPDLDIQSALLTIIEILDELDISYALTGSLACSIYGFPRSAQDVDIIADIHAEQLPLLIARLHQMFVFNEQQTIQSFSHYNFLSFLHLSSLVKVDILLPTGFFEYEALHRRSILSLIEGKPPVWILSPEDIALERLVWYQHTGAIADDQWNDILGLLKIQATTLNIQYLIIADIHVKHVQTLVTLLKNEYYIDGDRIQDAIHHHSSFAVLHHDTGVKVDVFILKLDTFSQQEMARARKEFLEEETRLFYLASPEDIILSKLAWWEMGGWLLATSME